MSLILLPRSPLKGRALQARVTDEEYAAIEVIARMYDTTVAATVRALLADALQRYEDSQNQS